MTADGERQADATVYRVTEMTADGERQADATVYRVTEVTGRDRPMPLCTG